MSNLCTYASPLAFFVLLGACGGTSSVMLGAGDGAAQGTTGATTGATGTGGVTGATATTTSTTTASTSSGGSSATAGVSTSSATTQGGGATTRGDSSTGRAGTTSGGSTAANDAGARCGDHTCAAGQYCCNASCGTCAPMGAACTAIACVDGSPGVTSGSTTSGSTGTTGSAQTSSTGGKTDAAADAATGACNTDKDCIYQASAGCCGQCLATTDPIPPRPAVCVVACVAPPSGCSCVDHQCTPFRSDAGVTCGTTICAAGMVCCNPVMSICTLPGQGCVQ